MIENLLDKLKAWEEIEIRAIDIFDIYRTEVYNDKNFRFLDNIDVDFNKQYVTLYFDELLPGDYEPYGNFINIPFEYFSEEKDVREYLKTLNTHD